MSMKVIEVDYERDVNVCHLQYGFDLDLIWMRSKCEVRMYVKQEEETKIGKVIGLE